MRRCVFDSKEKLLALSAAAAAAVALGAAIHWAKRTHVYEQVVPIQVRLVLSAIVRPSSHKLRCNNSINIGLGPSADGWQMHCRHIQRRAEVSMSVSISN